MSVFVMLMHVLTPYSLLVIRLSKKTYFFFDISTIYR